ncbi:MAG TPA: ribonuclease HI, partial [Gemmobacter sp.]|nr:ribonuclease HI [Gemmobacter sp.]
MPDLFAYTDGACSGNPGPGGWGVLMLAREGEAVVKERRLQGGEPDTTNNRM